MPNPLIERMARALFERFKERSAARLPKPQPGSYALDHWDNLPMSFKRDFILDACAALAAIQEPTEGMIRAGDAWREHCSDTDSLWSEMVNVALHGGKC